MAKKIQIDVEVNGKMQKATISAKKLRTALDGVEQGYQKAGASAGTYDRRTKGAAQATANGTKEFSKMSQGMGGLVGAYATVAASVFALSAAFNFLKNAADLAAQVAGQEMFAARTGTSMKLMTQNIQDATGGLVAFKEAAQAAAIGQAAGLTADQMERLGKVAKNAGTILGRDVTDSFNRLTRGAIKAEPELLDELGIIVRIKDASEEYAKTIGKNASELTTFEKSQAVVNAVLEQGEGKFSDVGDSINEVAAFGAKFRDTFKDMAGPIAEVANFFAGAFKDSILAVSAVFGILGISILKNIAPAGPMLANTANAAKNARERMKQAANKESKSVIAGEIQKGNFTKRVLKDIERAANSKTSTVLNLSKVEVAQVKRDLLIIRAENERLVAEQASGFTKMRAMWKYNLAVMQAEYGKFVGTIRFMAQGIVTAFTRALSIITFAGLAVMVVEIGKQIRQAFFISPDLAKAEKSVDSLTEKLKEQREEINEVKNSLNEATSGFNAMSQALGVVANYNLSPMKSQIAAIRKELEDLEDLRQGNTPDDSRSVNRPIDQGRYSEQITRATNLGIDSSVFTDVESLTTALNNLTIRKKELDEAFEAGIANLSGAEKFFERFFGRPEELKDLNAQLLELSTVAQSEGIRGLANVPGLPEINERLQGISATLPELKQNIIDLEAAEVNLDGLNIDPKFLKSTKDELNRLSAAYERGGMSAADYKTAVAILTDSYDDFIKRLGKGNERAAAANAAFQTIENGVKAFGDATDNFLPKESKFTAVYQGIQDVEGAIQTLVNNTNLASGSNTLSELLAVDSEAVDAQSDSFKRAADLLRRMTVDEEERLALTNDVLTLDKLREGLQERRLELAQAEVLLERQATLDKIEQLKIQRNQASYEKDFNSAASKRQDAERNLKVALQEQLNLSFLDLDVSQSQLDAAQDAVDLARAELGIAEDKYDLERELLTIKRAQAELSVDNSILQAQRDINTGLEKEINLRNQIASAREDRARRGIQTEAAERSAENPFFDSQAFIAQQTAELERSLVDQKIKAAQEEYNAKVLSIGMEFDLLKAKRLQTELELKTLAAKLDDENRGQEAEEVRAIAKAYGPAMAKVNQSARDQALELADINYRSTVEQIEETVRGAERTRDALEPINEILEEAGKIFESSLGTAFDKVFQATYDKTMDLGEELKKVGRDFVTQLQRKLTEKFIIEPLMEKIGGVFGDLFKEDDTGTKIKTALDTGGDALAQKIKAALGYTAAPYESPTQVGMAHSRDFVGEAAESRARMEALFATDPTTQAGVPAYGTPSANVQGILNAPVQARSLQESTMASFAPPTTSFTPTTGLASMEAPSGVSGDLSIASPTLPGEGGGGLSSAMENLGTKVSELTLETTGNIAAAGAVLAGLTGNEKAAQALATITALLQVAQLIRNAFLPAEAAQDAMALASEQFNTSAVAINTGALATNTLAIGLLTKAVLIDAATPLTKFGGIVSQGKLMPSYNDGGIGKGPKSGYMVEMHGTEAVVPLPNGKSIPVQLDGAGGTMQTNNVVVNVNMSKDGVSEENAQADQEQSKQLGRAVSLAVQREIKNQRRAGGMLSPYGAS